MGIERIETLARQFAQDRALLAERMRALHAEMDDAKRRKLPGIKSALGAAMDTQKLLRAEIDINRSDFARPKSRVFHGIKVGFQKAKGKLIFSDEQNVVKLIRKHFKDQFTVLVKVTEKPSKKALSALPADDLKKIGGKIVDTGDEIVAEPVDSEMDKMIDALLSNNVDDDSEYEQ